MANPRFTVPMILAVALGGCSKPRGVYVVPDHKDLGVVKRGTHVVSADFEIVNGLDRALDITEIYPSCTCTTVKLQTNPIPAGESATLTAEARLSDQTGKQKFFVSLTTDSPEFPTKEVSFEALVPATGTRRRRLQIGSFAPGAKIDLDLPSDSFTQGAVKLADAVEGGDRAIVHRIANSGGKESLVLTGTAPRKVGVFSKRVWLQEWFPGRPALGEGSVELDLVGSVGARWIVPQDGLYAGFITLGKDGGRFSLGIKHNQTVATEANRVSKVSAIFGKDWLSLVGQSASSDKIDLIFQINAQKLHNLGAVQDPLEMKIEYTDGAVESYSTTVFAHVDR